MVAFDATVLCNAILNEQSLDFELLVAAASSVPFSGFTTDVAGLEFVRNASEGFRTAAGVRAFTRDQIGAFLDTFAPLFELENVAPALVGRRLLENHALHDRPLGEVVAAITGASREQLLADLHAQPLVTSGPSIAHFDPFDLHLALAAVQRGADYLCTRNITDYSMDHIGLVAIRTPVALADEFGLLG